MNKSGQPNYSNRSSRQTSSQSLLSRPPSRPPSELLCDLHVYKVPPDLWRDAFNNILNNAVTETVSIGIIRVPIEIRLVDIRDEIVQQLTVNTEELVPRDYVFLRSVGRSLTTLRVKQEYQLKAKHFIPPVAYAPELFILEATPEIREALAISNASSQSPPISRQISPRSFPNTHRLGYAGVPYTERPNRHETSSPGNKYKSLPRITSDPYRGRDVNKNQYNHTSSSPSPHSNHNYPHDRYNDPFNPHHYKRKNSNSKNSPKTNKQPHENGTEQHGSDWDEQPENKRSSRDQTPPLKQSPLLPAQKGRNIQHDDVNGQSPEDDFLRHNRDEHNIFRRTKDLQKHLDSDRLSLDNETEEERRRRLEDLEDINVIDRQRWDADQDERRRQAKQDRLKEDEKKREKEDEERKQKENQERKKRDEEEKRKKDEEDRKGEGQDKIRMLEEKEKREEEEKRKQEEEMKQREEEKKRKESERTEKEELERKRREEIEKRRKDEQERRKKEEEERKQRAEHERQKEEEQRRKLKEAQRIPTPEVVNRDTESARQRRRDEKNQLLKDVEKARQGRQDQEKVREELVRKAKQMQHKSTNRRNEARDMWKKKYFEEKKKTAPLEESSNRLRNELETLHKKLVNTLEGPKENLMRLTDYRPSEKNNYVIQCTKTQHEIEDLQRRVENARMKLTAEMKLRNQAQGELRALRAELTQRKQNIEQNRQNQLASLNSYGKNDKENNHATTSLNHSRAFLEGV